jgi:hypothetical protein
VGLYLYVHPQGGKYWRFDNRFADKPKTPSAHKIITEKTNNAIGNK